MGYVVKSHWLVTFATWFLLKRIGMFWSFTKKDRWKRGWSLMDNYFKHNYCHACHTRFAVFFILLRMFTTHSPHSRPKNPVRFLLSCKADSRLQGPVENIPDGFSGWFKNRTKQNKTKQKQTNKKTFAVRSLLGQTGKILFLCMNNFSSKSCMSLYKLRLFLRSMFNIKNYYIINIILLIISNDPVLENVQHKVTELNPHRHAYPGITEVCKPWSWAWFSLPSHTIAWRKWSYIKRNALYFIA